MSAWAFINETIVNSFIIFVAKIDRNLNNNNVNKTTEMRLMFTNL